MDIYEEIKMFTKPNFTKDEYMEDLVRDWRNYDNKIYDDLENFSISMGHEVTVAHEREETLPALLYDENKEEFEKLCPKNLMPVHRNLLVIDEVNIYARKVIDDDLSPEEQAEKKENFHDEIRSKIRENIENHGTYYNYIYENNSVELKKIPDWAIDKLYDIPENTAVKLSKHLKNKDFKLYLQLSSKESSLDFMKEVVKIHGTNGKILDDAIFAVTEHKNESPAFMSKLLNDTLKTEEYKKAFETEQKKEQENIR